VASILLALMFPHEGKFKYEYQKGKPWRHEVLIAPFDFPVYKELYVLEKERDSLLRNSSPYYNYNPKIQLVQKGKFREYFEWHWKSYVIHHPKMTDEIHDYILKNTLNYFDFIYNNGIIELADDVPNLKGKEATFILVKENIAEEIDYSSVFTLKSAFQYIRHSLNTEADKISTEKGLQFDDYIKSLRVESYLTPNLFYDEGTTLSAREADIKNLSLTQGMIQTGERIIFTGDMVTPRLFQVLESLKKEYETRMGSSAKYYIVFGGQLIIVAFLMILLMVFVTKFRKEVVVKKNRVLFLYVMVLLFSVIAFLFLKFKIASIYLLPYAILPILIKTFYDNKLAVYVHIITMLIIGFWAPNSFEFILLNITAGIVALLSLTNLYRRNKMFVSSTWITLSYCILYIALWMFHEGEFLNINFKEMLVFVGNGLLVLLAVPLIYIFEKAFGFLSDASLLELTDTNQTLLRKLAEVAPGTFQHSLQVANLAEDAIFHIGGNPLLVRAGALYHDIGKVDNPMFFIENQTEGLNPHKDLTEELSAEIIKSHVNKGIELAQKHNLPEQIIDFIRTHHGTTTTNYFYRNYLLKNPDSINNSAVFMYQGPKPFTREQAVVMMADSVEAASRSLKIYTEQTLNDLVENIISYQMNEGQYNDSDITLNEIFWVKHVFKRRLKNIYHIRIEYPQ
jgi:putative nucleotidyltransferase with HDIG domain